VKRRSRKRDGGSSGNDRMTEEEKPTTTKPTPKQTDPQFILKLEGKKVTNTPTRRSGMK
jgi:hypothetical protein